MPLGWFDDNPLVEHELELAPGDLLVLYTDGITEACNRAMEEFGMDRLQAAVGGCDDRTAAGCLACITGRVDSFTDGAPASDDMTLIVVRRVTRGDL